MEEVALQAARDIGACAFVRTSSRTGRGIETLKAVVCELSLRMNRKEPHPTLDEMQFHIEQFEAGRMQEKVVLRSTEEAWQRVDFSELVAATGRCVMESPAERGITLKQLRRLTRHVTRRLRGGEVWLVSRYREMGWQEVEMAVPEDVVLYDVNTYVILPATTSERCSMVELLAEHEQKPDYFVSHWWGERVKDFVMCLEQHSSDRKLVDCKYWVCAYANNQHHVDLGATLKESPFYAAMKLCRGAVSIVDPDGVTWSRIWCVFELYTALISHDDFVLSDQYTFDLYTAKLHYIGSTGTQEGIRGFSGQRATVVQTAATSCYFPVGITQGLAAVDGSISEKAKREQHFPIELLDKGIRFQCLHGAASVKADKELIIRTIGESSAALDDVVHGLIAVSALPRVLGTAREEEFLRAMGKGRDKMLDEEVFSAEESRRAYYNEDLSGWPSREEISEKLGAQGCELCSRAGAEER